MKIFHLEACESSRDDFILNIFANVYGYLGFSFNVYVDGILLFVVKQIVFRRLI